MAIASVALMPASLAVNDKKPMVSFSFDHRLLCIGFIPEDGTENNALHRFDNICGAMSG